MHGTGVIEAWEYSSATGHIFAPISLLVTRDGLIVTEKLTRDAEELLARTPESSAVRRISVGLDAKGYIYGAAGPGGSETILAVNLPGANLDLQIKLSVPAETPLDRIEQSSSYYRLVTDGGSLLEDALLSTASQAVDRILSTDRTKNYTGASISHEDVIVPSTPPRANSWSGDLAPPASSPPLVSKQSSHANDTAPTKGGQRLVVALILVAIALAVLFYRLRKRRRATNATQQ